MGRDSSVDSYENDSKEYKGYANYPKARGRVEKPEENKPTLYTRVRGSLGLKEKQ